MEQLLPFCTFSDKTEAQKIKLLLEQHAIIVQLEASTPLLDSNFIGVDIHDPWVIRIPGKNFEEATKLIRENITINLEEVDKDYLLLSFSNEELADVIAKENEWGPYNAKLATALLHQRNVAIPEDKIAHIRQVNKDRRSKPVSIDITAIILGYLSAIAGGIYTLTIGTLAVYVFPGLLAFAIGGFLVKSKRTLENGTQIAYFNRRAILHGKIILLLSFTILVAEIIYMLLS